MLCGVCLSSPAFFKSERVAKRASPCSDSRLLLNNGINNPAQASSGRPKPMTPLSLILAAKGANCGKLVAWTYCHHVFHASGAWSRPRKSSTRTLERNQPPIAATISNEDAKTSLRID